VQLAGERVVKDFMDKRTLPGAADAGNGNERAEREANVNVLEVIVACALDSQRRV
jgi:hypothetical protein